MKQYGKVLWLVLGMSVAAWAEEKAAPLRVAVMDFEVTSGNEKAGGEVADKILARVAEEKGVTVVERQSLHKLLEEQKLTLSGLVEPKEAVQIGKLAGAQLLVCGRVSARDGTIRIAARIISPETSRLTAVVEEAPADKPLGTLADQAGQTIAQKIAQLGRRLIATETAQDSVAPLIAKLAGRKLPLVYVHIPEQHVGRQVPDPAAQTELMLVLQQAGVPILDPTVDKAEEKAELVVTGEGISSFATRTNDLVTCVARLEMKVRKRGGGDTLDLIDRATTRRADVSEALAAKLALEDAGRAMAVKLLEYLDRTAPPAEKK